MHLFTAGVARCPAAQTFGAKRMDAEESFPSCNAGDGDGQRRIYEFRFEKAEIADSNSQLVVTPRDRFLGVPSSRAVEERGEGASTRQDSALPAGCACPLVPNRTKRGLPSAICFRDNPKSARNRTLLGAAYLQEASAVRPETPVTSARPRSCSKRHWSWMAETSQKPWPEWAP